MKNARYTFFLYVLFLLLVVSCTDQEEAVPACVQVEVLGPDCASGWYLLQILDNEDAGEQRSRQYIGQLQSGIVTTKDLPAELQKPGVNLALSLELNNAEGPRCVSVYMIYPPVHVKQVCSSGDAAAGSVG